MQHLQDILSESAAALSVQVEHLPQAVDRFFTEWKERGKEIEALESRLAKLQIEQLNGEEIGGVEVVIRKMDLPRSELVNIATGIADQKGVALFFSNADGVIVVMGSGSDAVNAGEIIKEICPILGGKGGGKPGLAQGAGQDREAIPDALRKAEELIYSKLHG